jgi:hypothetical protein
MKRFTTVLALIIIGSVFISCAAIGKMIEPGPWLGLLNLAAAGGITIFILKGTPERIAK